VRTDPATDATASPISRAELFRALGVFAEPPGTAHLRLAELLDLPVPSAGDWAEGFVVQLVPHAAIYLSPDGMLGGEPADRVAGFWRALRLPVPPDPDHLTALLGLYASLLDAERSEVDPARRLLRRQARTALLHEHLVSWLLPYTHGMAEVGPEPYACWADRLAEALRAEIADVEAPDQVPAALRNLPALPGSDAGFEAMVSGLLAPARSGILLTRAHLAGVARRGSLGLRLGDRRQILRALLEQDATATLAELAGQAGTWVERHRADQKLTGPVAHHWATRAEATFGLFSGPAEARVRPLARP